MYVYPRPGVGQPVFIPPPTTALPVRLRGPAPLLLVQLPQQQRPQRAIAPKPKVPKGYHYMFPDVPLVPLHIFAKGTNPDVLTNGQSHRQLAKHLAFMVPNTMTMQQFARQVAGEDGYTIFQVREAGDGRWDKGNKFDTRTARGNLTMEQAGWSSARPTWVVLKKEQ